MPPGSHAVYHPTVISHRASSRFTTRFRTVAVEDWDTICSSPSSSSSATSTITSFSDEIFGSAAGVFEAMPSYDAMPPGLPEPFADGLSLSLQMRAAAEAMQSGDMSALVALRAKLAQVEEENRRLREQGGGRRARKGGAAGGGAADDEEDEEDEQEVADRKTYERYEEAMDAVMAAFGRGVTPSSELYAARDLQLYRLSDSDLQAEYARYSAMYLDDDTSSAVRGMCEMSLIKMGEMVDKPQARRIQMVARQAEEAAFWTFVAIVELQLPSDFYSAPTMAGLQRDVRVLFELFLLARDAGELPTPQGADARGGAIRDEE